MKLLFRKNRKGSSSKDNKVIDSSLNETGMAKKPEGEAAVRGEVNPSESALLDPNEITLEQDLINNTLPRELLLRIFSFLDVISITRSAQVCKVKHIYLALSFFVACIKKKR
jgi:hypothetical protein